MHPNWARLIRDDCQDMGVSFFHKQNGEFISKDQIASWTGDNWTFLSEEWHEAIRGKEWSCLDINGKYRPETTTWNGRQNDPQDDYEIIVYKVGRYAAGRLLDGEEWNEFPIDVTAESVLKS